MQYIGIDVSKRRLHSAWLRDPQRGLIKTKASDNTPEGLLTAVQTRGKMADSPALEGAQAEQVMRRGQPCWGSQNGSGSLGAKRSGWAWSCRVRWSRAQSSWMRRP